MTAPARADDGAAGGADLRFDLLVVGAGMAGLTAAAVAASRGAEVLVVDKEPAVGGSAAISGGHIWTAPTAEVLSAESPASDPALAALLLARFGEAVDWIRSTGVEMTDELTVLGYGRGYRFDVLRYLERCQGMVEAAGGWVLPGRAVTALLTSSGAVCGALIRDDRGETTAVSAPWTLLATGGFSAALDLIGRHICPSENVVVRSAPGATGDGLRLAAALGAATTETMSPFYGHLVGWPVRRWGREQFIRLSFFSSTEGLLLDLDGRRFTDESRMDHRNAQAVARCRDGRAVLVFDAGMTASALATKAADGMNKPDPFTESIAEGANAVECGRLGDLGAALTSWGFDGAEALRTLRAYDEAARSGTPDPPRLRGAPRFAEPPFRAVEVRSGITMTEGGLAVDA